MPKLLSGSIIRRGGSEEFLDLRGAMPQLPTSPSTTTGFTLYTDELLRTTYRSSLGNIEMNLGQMWSNQPDGVLTLVGTGTGYVYVSGTTEAESTDTGALVVGGGIGVAGGIWTGKDIHVNQLTIGQGFQGQNNIVIQGPDPVPDAEYEYPDGQENIAIGWSALKNIGSAIKSIAIGRNALGSGTNIVKSLAIGDSALQLVGTIPQNLIHTLTNFVGYAGTAISGATNDAPVVVTSINHGLSSGQRVTIVDVDGLSTSTNTINGPIVFSLVNDKSFFVNILTPDTFELHSGPELSTSTAINGDLLTWSAYSSGGFVYKPAEIDVSGTDYTTGTEIVLDGIVGPVELNGNTFWVYPVTGTVFQLYQDNILAKGYNGTSSTAYVSDGITHRNLKKDNNIALGTNAGNKLYDGEQNFFFGDNIAPNLTTGSYNFFMGHDVALNMTKGSGNISFMGGNLVDGVDNQVNIGGILYYNGDGFLQLNADTGLGLGTNSTSSTTGALVVFGGQGILSDLWVGGTIYSDLVGLASTATNIAGGARGSTFYQVDTGTTAALAIGNSGTVLLSDGNVPRWADPTEIVSMTSTNSMNVLVGDASSGTYYLGMVDTIGSYVQVDSTATVTYSPETQTLTVEKLAVNNTNWNTGTNTSNALYLRGGAWVEESLVVGGPAVFKSDVIFSGTATYVYSTNTFYTDNFIDLHVPPGGIDTLWVADDGKDIGLIFHYYKGADKRGFLGFANDSSYLEWYDDGQESGGIYTGTSYGTFKTGAIQLEGSVQASNTLTGTLRIVGGGGIGLGGNIFAGGDIRGASLTGANLTSGRISVVGVGGTLYDYAALSYNTTTNIVQGTITTATNATNLLGGAPGSIAYQTSTNTTVFLPIGAVDYILRSDGTAPGWAPLDGLTVGKATTATNLDFGNVGQIPFQTAVGLTGFSSTLTFSTLASVLSVDTLNTTSGGLYVSSAARIGGSLEVGHNITSTGTVRILNTAEATSSTNSGALQVSGGASVTKDLYVGGNIFVSGDIFLDGTAIEGILGTTATFSAVFITGTNIALNVTDSASIGGDLTVSGSSTLTNLEVTGSTILDQTLSVTSTATFSNKVLINDVTQSTTTATGALQVLGGVGVTKNLNVGGTLTVGSTVDSTVVSALSSNVFNLSSYSRTGISSNGTVNLDTFSAAEYRTARYLVQIVDGSNIHITEITLFHDGTSVYQSEYGISTNNGELGVFSSQLVGGIVTLTFTPIGATNMTIKIQRTAITV